MKTLHVWIVEMKGFFVWSATVGCSLTRSDARLALQEWRKQCPHDQFRVTKYTAFHASQSRA